mmetsp:Transcript_13165/g.38389  ORF Transcript_13165/g.38389 Transcript_13165/m.38389 type:complete len:279 (+) Transcript_13165:1142-1978(+)
MAKEMLLPAKEKASMTPKTSAAHPVRRLAVLSFCRLHSLTAAAIATPARSMYSKASEPHRMHQLFLAMSACCISAIETRVLAALPVWRSGNGKGAEPLKFEMLLKMEVKVPAARTAALVPVILNANVSSVRCLHLTAMPVAAAASWERDARRFVTASLQTSPKRSWLPHSCAEPPKNSAEYKKKAKNCVIVFAHSSCCLLVVWFVQAFVALSMAMPAKASSEPAWKTSTTQVGTSGLRRLIFVMPKPSVLRAVALELPDPLEALGLRGSKKDVWPTGA